MALDLFGQKLAREARERIRTAPQRVSALSRELTEDLARARAFTSSDYSPEGLVKQREMLAEAARNKHRAAVERLRREVDSDRETIARHAREARPRLGDDAVSLQRAQMAWDGVRDRLAAGMSWQAILAGADERTVLAIEQWGPAWMEAQAHRDAQQGQPVRYDPAPLQSAIHARLLEVADRDARTALAAEADAAEAVAGFEPMENHVSALLAGAPSDPLAASLGAHIGAQLARPTLAGVDGGPGDGGEAA